MTQRFRLDRFSDGSPIRPGPAICRFEPMRHGSKLTLPSRRRRSFDVVEDAFESTSDFLTQAVRNRGNVTTRVTVLAIAMNRVTRMGGGNSGACETSTSRRAIRMWHPCFDAYVSNPRATVVARSDRRGPVRNPGRAVAETHARAARCARGSSPRPCATAWLPESGRCMSASGRSCDWRDSISTSVTDCDCMPTRSRPRGPAACDSQFAPPLSRPQE